MEGKPIFRWAGSKRLTLGKLDSYWNKDYDRYIEPFAGSAQLFFHLRPKKAILSDLNSDLISTYKCIKKSAPSVYEQLLQLPRGKEHYYRIRALDPQALEPDLKAARFIYLNRFCFNGLYRTNLKGEFNVPFGTRTGEIPTWENFEASSRMLNKARFLCSDFNDVLIDHARSGDFVYLDPPYAVENRRIFRQYNPQTFGLADLERLESTLHILEKRKVDFVISYAYCKEALSLFKRWDIRTISTQRFISGFGKFRKKAKEVIVSNIV